MKGFTVLHFCFLTLYYDLVNILFIYYYIYNNII